MATILLVEDDRPLASHWQQALEAEGFRVVHEPSVEGAIDALDSMEFDLVITDIVLESEDAQLSFSGGLAVISYIALNIDPQPKIIATSGMDSQSAFVDRNFRRMNSLRAIQKPIEVSRLIATVKELLAGTTAEIPSRLEIQSAVQSRVMLDVLGDTDGVWDWQVGQEEAQYSAGWRKMLGFAGDDRAGFPNTLAAFTDRIHADDRDAVWQSFNRTLAEGAPYAHEFRIRNKEGQYIWLQSRGRASYNEAGEPIRLVGSAHDISRRKANERELQLARSAIANSGDAVFMVNEQGRFIFVNDMACRSSGYSRAELLGMAVADLNVDIDSAEAFTNKIAPMVRSQKNTLITGRHRRKDSSTFPVEVAIVLVEVGDEQVFCANVRDLTDRQEAAAVLEAKKLIEKSEERIAWATRSANIGIWDWDIRRDKLFVSETYKSQLGIEPEEKFADLADWKQRLHPDDKEQVIREIDTHLEGDQDEYESTYRMRHYDGSYRWLFSRGKAQFDEQGKPLRMLGIHIDATELDQTQFNVMARVIPDSFYIFDLFEKKAVFENRPIYDTSIAPTEDELPILRHVHPDDRQRMIDHAEKLKHCPDGEILEVEYRIRQKDGSYRSFLARDTPYRFDTLGTVRQIVGAATDVTRIREYTEQLERSSLLLHEANRELTISNSDLEQFASAASHDLQEPLRAVNGFVQLLQHKYLEDLDDQAIGYIENAVAGVERMSKVIEGLLNYSRVGKSDNLFEAVSLNEVVDDAIASLSDLIERSCAKISVEQLPTAYGSKILLSQLFQNLLGNAIKYRDKENTPEIKVSGETVMGMHKIKIQDNGIGIEQQYQAQIFGLFKRLHHRREYPGTGLGLAIVKRIADRHEGMVSVESKPGIGSCFTISLPAK